MAVISVCEQRFYTIEVPDDVVIDEISRHGGHGGAEAPYREPGEDVFAYVQRVGASVKAAESLVRQYAEDANMTDFIIEMVDGGELQPR